MTLPDELLALIKKFEDNLEEHLRSFNEDETRYHFIEPFFQILGWNMVEEAGKPAAWRDVLRQPSITVAAGRKAPDYIFKYGKTEVFVVEAKQPSLDLDSDAQWALQARSYGWHKKLPVVLTNFRELAIYDYRLQPKKKDSARTALMRYYRYTDYAAKWEEIAGILSKAAVSSGQLDKFIEVEKAKGLEVDEAFLKEIEGWRKLLASNIALRNPRLSQRELNSAVQMTLDRIIFLRICEDRRIENRRLEGLTNSSRIYPRLFKWFEDADDRYNSGLFHFREERGQTSEPDRITPGLKVDDDKLKTIIRSLYDNYYDFSLIPIEILGQIYEKFLGNVIYLTEGHQARVREKPEVKKAGGVFYTPSYIVKFIVSETVERLLENKNPAQAAKLKILDPACGSGSFLLGAYQALLDWHLDYYTREKPERYQRQIYPVLDGGYRLSISEKKRILLNNIFGVDIDPQAVEVTKLSLLLKVLEGETEASVKELKLIYQERALPDLGNNVKCGNSIIGLDIERNHQLNFLEDEERARINAFDWETGFPEVFKDKEGGFDAVLGNPPYGAASFTPRESNYYLKHYSLFQEIRDLYAVFIEMSLNILRKGGQFSFIVPSAWLGGPRYDKLRSFLLNYKIKKVLLLPFDVFKDAYVDTAIVVLSQERATAGHQVLTYVFGKKEKLFEIRLAETSYHSVKQNQWKKSADKKIVLDPHTISVLERIQDQTSLRFDEVIRIKRGVLFNQQLLTAKKTSASSYRYFEGDVYRYQLNLICRRWIEFNNEIMERPKEFDWFQGKRILLRRLVNRKQRLMATISQDTFITNKNLYSILPMDDSINLNMILGILNSQLISYLYLHQVTQATKDDFPQVTIKDILALPFPERAKIKSGQDRMAKLVEQILKLHQQLERKLVDYERASLKRQIESLDRQIDQLVYELYGLTEEEIKVVEGES